MQQHCPVCALQWAFSAVNATASSVSTEPNFFHRPDATDNIPVTSIFANIFPKLWCQWLLASSSGRIFLQSTHDVHWLFRIHNEKHGLAWLQASSTRSNEKSSSVKLVTPNTAIISRQNRLEPWRLFWRNYTTILYIPSYVSCFLLTDSQPDERPAVEPTQCRVRSWERRGLASGRNCDGDVQFPKTWTTQGVLRTLHHHQGKA